jgi:hypothetical protein
MPEEVNKAITNALLTIMQHLPTCPEKALILNQFTELSKYINFVFQNEKV